MSARASFRTEARRVVHHKAYIITALSLIGLAWIHLRTAPSVSEVPGPRKGIRDGVVGKADIKRQGARARSPGKVGDGPERVCPSSFSPQQSMAPSVFTPQVWASSCADLGEGPDRGRGFAVRIGPPAGNRAIGLQPAAVISPCADLREGSGRGVCLGMITVPPAGNRAVGLHSAGVISSRADLREGPGRGLI